MALAENDGLRLLAELGLVFQVHTMDAVGERYKAPDRVFAAGEKVPAIDAGADAWIATLDGLHDGVQLVVQSAGSMIVNRNADVVLGDKFVKAGKRLGIGLWISRDRANAELLGEFKNACVGR